MTKFLFWKRPLYLAVTLQYRPQAPDSVLMPYHRPPLTFTHLSHSLKSFTVNLESPVQRQVDKSLFKTRVAKFSGRRKKKGSGWHSNDHFAVAARLSRHQNRLMVLISLGRPNQTICTSTYNTEGETCSIQRQVKYPHLRDLIGGGGGKAARHSLYISCKGTEQSYLPAGCAHIS